MKLKIGTYNICHCVDFSNGNGSGAEFYKDVKIDKTAYAINKLGLDIIGLNEVYSQGEVQGFVNQTGKIACFTGHKYFEFALGEKYPNATIGNAILSNYEIVKTQSVIVKKPPVSERPKNGKWWEDRVLLVADINVLGKTIRVIQTHFGLNQIEQENIVSKLIEIIDASEYPVILMGDFNVEPDNPVLECIYERLKSVAKEVGNTEFTFASYAPKERIDYIFVPKSTKINSFTVHDIKSSDHRPITAEIEV